MNTLEKVKRPLIVFNENNKEHRRLLFEFMKTNTWGYCPYRFDLPNEDGQNLVYAMQKRVLEHYLKKEFE